MKKCLFGCLLVLFSLLAFGTEKPKVTVVYMEGFEPSSWEEDGVPMGIQVDIVDYCLKQLGINPIHKFYPWARAQKLVETGEADLMVTVANNARFEYAIFGKETTHITEINLFIPKVNFELKEKAKNFKILEDLKPYKLIDYIGNGWQMDYMKKEHGFNVELVPKMEQIPQTLLAGRYDMVMAASPIMNRIIYNLKLTNKFEEIDTDFPNTEVETIFMVSKKSPWVEKGLIKALDTELIKMKKSGKWKEILEKYHVPSNEIKSKVEPNNFFYKDYDSYPIYKAIK